MQSLLAKKEQIDAISQFSFDILGEESMHGPLKNMLLDFKIKVALAISLRRCE
jgi:hypothetical protein